MSIISSAARIISSSCSTTITELPRSRSCFSTFIRRLVSRGWRPMLGSSSMYSDPTRLLPSDVARLMRCDSPPERVDDRRLSVRYPKPTSVRNCSRLRISTSKRLATLDWCSSSSSRLKKTFSSSIGISTSSLMVVFPIFTYPASGFSLAPLQTGQMVLPMYRDSITRYCILYFFSSRYSKNPSIPVKWLFPFQSSLFCSGERSQ